MHSAHIRGHLETIRYINITGYTGGDRGKWNKDLQMILDRGTCDKEGFIVPNRRGERRGQDNVSHFENKTYRLRMKFAPPAGIALSSAYKAGMLPSKFRAIMAGCTGFHSTTKNNEMWQNLGGKKPHFLHGFTKLPLMLLTENAKTTPFFCRPNSDLHNTQNCNVTLGFCWNVIK